MQKAYAFFYLYIKWLQIVFSVLEDCDKILNMKYYIDFDNTLFSTNRLKNKMLESIAKACTMLNSSLNYDEILIECNQNFCREKIYNIYELCEYIGKKYSTSSNVLSDKVNEVIDNGKEFVYADTTNFLLKLKNDGETIILLTQTTTDNIPYQKRKIDGCGLKHFFDDIIFTTTNKYTLDIDYKNSTFVDDNPTELLGLCKADAKNIIRVKRADCKYSKIQLYNNKIVEVSSFDEIDEILKQKIGNAA